MGIFGESEIPQQDWDGSAALGLGFSLLDWRNFWDLGILGELEMDQKLGMDLGMLRSKGKSGSG